MNEHTAPGAGNTLSVTNRASQPLLEIAGLEIDFATSEGPLRAVRGISFEVSPGEIVGVVGESGSGKSVTAQAALRILPANGRVAAGAIRYRGDDIAAFTGERLRAYRGNEVAMVFQEPGRAFDPIYSIGRSLIETLRAHKREISEPEARARAIQLLEEVHVPNAAARLNNFPHQFSGGLLQRIGIAHALANDPAVLFADEPTTALDVTIQAGIVQLLLELRRARELSIVFITHNLALISAFADRLVVMYGGMVMEQGPAARVLKHPHHPYTAGLLASLIPFGTHASSARLATLAGSPPNPLQPEPGCPFAPRCPAVTDRCRAAVPEFQAVEGSSNHLHRCVLSGEKAGLFGAGGEANARQRERAAKTEGSDD